MPSSSLPRFVLKPWEFEGAAYLPFADAVITCQWNGEAVLMRLKVHQNLLFFALLDDDERLFACAEPVADTRSKAHRWRFRVDRLEKWFRLALESDWWTRAVEIPRLGPRSLHTPVLAFIKCDGFSWLRRIYEDEDHAFWLGWPGNEPESHHELLSWQNDDLSKFLGDKLKARHSEIVLLSPSMAARNRAVIPQTWSRGNLRELVALTREAITIYEDFSTWRSRWNNEPSPAKYAINSHTVIRPMHLACDDNHRAAIPPILEELFRVFSQLHECVAQRFDGSNLCPATFPIEVPQSDSAHERLEAMLRLRDAVRGTRIETEVAKILKQAQPGS